MGGREWNTHKKTQRIFKIFKMMSIFFFFCIIFLVSLARKLDQGYVLVFYLF